MGAEENVQIATVRAKRLRSSGYSRGHFYISVVLSHAYTHPLPVIPLQVDPFFERGVRLCREGGDGSALAGYVEARFLEHTSGGV